MEGYPGDIKKEAIIHLGGIKIGFMKKMEINIGIKN